MNELNPLEAPPGCYAVEVMKKNVHASECIGCCFQYEPDCSKRQCTPKERYDEEKTDVI